MVFDEDIGLETIAIGPRGAPARSLLHTARRPATDCPQGRGGVAVESDAGGWHGRCVVVALPPTLAGRIDYQPALPALRDQLTQRVPQGSLIKFEAVRPAVLAHSGPERPELQRPPAGPFHLR